MTPTRVFAALLWAALFYVVVQQGLSLAGTPLPGGYAPGLQGWVTLALPAFFAGTLPLWMRGHPLDMKQIRDGVGFIACLLLLRSRGHRLE